MGRIGGRSVKKRLRAGKKGKKGEKKNCTAFTLGGYAGGLAPAPSGRISPPYQGSCSSSRLARPHP